AGADGHAQLLWLPELGAHTRHTEATAWKASSREESSLGRSLAVRHNGVANIPWHWAWMPGTTRRKRTMTANMNIILIGAQGSGKGTQTELLSREFDLKSLASGELLRDAMERNTPSGQKARPYYDRGDLVPDDIVVDMIVEHLDDLDGKRGIVLDGFPRTNAQAYALDVALVQRGQQVNWAIYLDAPREL